MMIKNMFINLPAFALTTDQLEFNHIHLDDFKLVIPRRRRFEKDIYCNSFDELSFDVKEEIASRWIRDTSFLCANDIVEYVLSTCYDNPGPTAPFSHDELEVERTGEVVMLTPGHHVALEEILTVERRDELIETYDRISDWWQDRYGTFYPEKIEALESLINQDNGEIGKEFDQLEAKYRPLIEELEARQGKASDHHDRTLNILSDLESLDCEDEQEIMQWFMVDSDVAYWLKKEGEPMLDDRFWGRTCCGQGISSDHVIQKIAFNALSQGV